MDIIITDQHNDKGATTAAYRVELLNDAYLYGYGLGYGETPESAYAEARRNYQESLEDGLRRALRDADLDFLKQMRDLKSEVGS